MDTFENVLEHHGIKGMRWGVRRPRGSSGRVTGTVPASTPHHANGESQKLSAKIGPEHHMFSKKLSAVVHPNKQVSEDAAVFKELTTKARTHGLSSLSNAELKKFNERFDMEKKFSKLEEERKKNKDSRARKIASKVLDQMAERALTNLAGHVVDAHVNKIKTGKAVSRMLPKP